MLGPLHVAQWRVYRLRVYGRHSTTDFFFLSFVRSDLVRVFWPNRDMA